MEGTQPENSFDVQKKDSGKEGRGVVTRSALTHTLVAMALNIYKKYFDAPSKAADAPAPGTTYGASLHGELDLLVRAGLTPIEALAAATSAPARIFHLQDRGRLRPGMRADLVLVDGDPTRDIRATRKIVAVWKRGIRVQRVETR